MSDYKIEQKEVVVTAKDHAFADALAEASSELSKSNMLSGFYSVYLALPLPSLSLRYLLQYEGFPLGCFVLIIGEKASFKSNLSCFLAKLHNDLSGYTIIFDTEGGSAPLASAILHKQFLIEDCPFLENWQVKLVKYSNKLSEAVANGKVYPVCFIIDSIAGGESLKTGEKIEEEGLSVAAYPTEARLLSAFIRHKSKILLTNPFTIIGTNHVKKVLNPTTGSEEEYFPGGKSLMYHAHIALRVRKTKKPELLNDAYRFEIQISVEKNRIGPERLCIHVPVTIKGGDVPEVKLGWHQSTTDLLCEGTGFAIRTKDKILNKIKEIVNIESRSGGCKGTLYFCPAIGINRENAVSAEEMGMAIEEQKEILKALYKLLMIRSAPMFMPGENYLKQIEKAKDSILKAREST